MYWNQYLPATITALNAIDPARLRSLARCIYNAWEAGRTVLTCGNGGSASNASHLAQDLSKGTLVEGDWSGALRTICLCDNVSALTAWANDEGYEHVFSAQLHALGQPGDVLIAISGSGNSENVLKAVRLANKLEMHTWGICGFDGGGLLKLAHRAVHVPSEDMGIVEACHGVVFHWLVERLKAAREGRLSIMDEWIGVSV